MATVDEHTAQLIIKANGYFDDDPRCLKVVTYDNDFTGAKCWALVYPGEDYLRYERSPMCHNVQVIWEAR